MALGAYLSSRREKPRSARGARREEPRHCFLRDRERNHVRPLELAIRHREALLPKCGNDAAAAEVDGEYRVLDAVRRLILFDRFVGVWSGK